MRALAFVCFFFYFLHLSYARFFFTCCLVVLRKYFLHFRALSNMTPVKRSINMLKYYEEIDSDHVKYKTCFRVIKNDRVFNLRKHLQLHDIRPEQQENNSGCMQTKKTVKLKLMKVKINKKNFIRCCH